MTRIIAGTAGGRRLQTPAGEQTRPTSDRVREALFSLLEARDAVRGARVLDLFAGSGALGLEAASRGATEVTLVEHSRPGADTARRNAAALGLEGVRVVPSTVRRYLGRPAADPVDLAFLDPPYALPEEELAEYLTGLAEPGRLAPDALVVVERSARSPEPTWPAGWQPLPPRRYGETAVWLAVQPGDQPRSR